MVTLVWRIRPFPFPDLLAEIGDVAGEDDAVGDGDDFVLKGLKARDVEAAFEHHAGGIPYLDDIPHPERPLVGQADAGNQVGNGRTGAQGEKDADEDGNAFESR